MSPYNVIDHASDVGIEVKADSLEDLFADAVKGLLFLITDKKPDELNILKGKINKRKIHLQFDTLDNALIELLNRIILLTYSKGLLFIDPVVKIKKNRLVMKSNVVKDAFSLMEREIKAATYHDYSIKNEDGLYYTSVIFDI